MVRDMKAQVGKEKFLKQENTQYIETNDNEKLCNLVIKTNMVRSSTKFMHLKRNKANQKSCSQIGYVLINKKKKTIYNQRCTKRSYKGSCADSDHFLGIAKMQ